jgi:HEPN domain-containing protein
LRRIARERLNDAKSLLANKRWSGAYYLCGYSVECGLKSCILRYLGESAAIFGEQSYLKRLANCWTHDLEELVRLAGLTAQFGMDRGLNPRLEDFWIVTKDWKETSRYERRTKLEARDLYTAVSNNPDGVFRWIQSHW